MNWISELNVFGMFRRRQYVPIICGTTIIAGAFVYDTDGKKISNYRDNARLIAAAPELLAALDDLYLQALQSDVAAPSNEYGAEALDRARAALAKVRGEP